MTTIKIKEIYKNIILVESDKSSDLAKVFLRFQEFYESPKFRNTIFSLNEYRLWYSKTNGAFTYYDDWSGFNIPGEVTIPFRTGLFDHLSPEEKELLDKIPHRLEKYYIIGISKDKDVYNHELCHALYYTNSKYKQEVDKILKKYDLSKLSQFLRELGYHESVILDECHAYLSDDSGYLREKGLGIPKASIELLKLFEKSIKELE